MENKAGGMGFCSVLTLILVVLKVFGVIKLSWLMVFSPIWFPIAVFCIFLLIIALGGKL